MEGVPFHCAALRLWVLQFRAKRTTAHLLWPRKTRVGFCTSPSDHVALARCSDLRWILPEVNAREAFRTVPGQSGSSHPYLLSPLNTDSKCILLKFAIIVCQVQCGLVLEPDWTSEGEKQATSQAEMRWAVLPSEAPPMQRPEPVLVVWGHRGLQSFRRRKLLLQISCHREQLSLRRHLHWD